MAKELSRDPVIKGRKRSSICRDKGAMRLQVEVSPLSLQ